MLYAAIGCLTQHSDHGDIKRLALNTRRRLRATSDTAAQEATRTAALPLTSSERNHEEASSKTDSNSASSRVAHGKVTDHDVTEEGKLDSMEVVSMEAGRVEADNETADSGTVDSSALDQKFVAIDKCADAIDAVESVGNVLGSTS